MNYTIRKSLIEDLPDILCLRDEAREYMRNNGNLHQWPVGYPPEDTFISDIESGNSYIVENSNGIPVGTFAFLPCPEPTYQTIYKGKWLAEDLPYYVIHRIASKSSCWSFVFLKRTTSELTHMMITKRCSIYY